MSSLVMLHGCHLAAHGMPLVKFGSTKSHVNPCMLQMGVGTKGRIVSMWCFTIAKFHCQLAWQTLCLQNHVQHKCKQVLGHQSDLIVQSTPQDKQDGPLQLMHLRSSLPQQ